MYRHEAGTYYSHGASVLVAAILMFIKVAATVLIATAVNLIHSNWKFALGLGGVAAVATILTAIVDLAFHRGAPPAVVE